EGVRARRSIRPAPAPRPTPTTGAAARAPPLEPGHRPSAPTLRSSRSHLRDGRVFQVRDVVDAGDDSAPVALLEHRDRRVLDLEGKQPSAGAADDAMQRNLDDAAVSDDQEIAVLVPGNDVIQLSGDASVERRRALASGYDVPVGLFDPAGPRLWVACGDLLGAEAFPLAEEDLTQAFARLGIEAEGGAEHLGGLERAPEVARVEAGEAPAGEGGGRERRLAAALV